MSPHFFFAERQAARWSEQQASVLRVGRHHFTYKKFKLGLGLRG